MGFIARIGQAFSGFNASQVIVPVTTATIGNGTLLVSAGFGVNSSTITVSSVTDTQGNTYVRDAQANPATFRCAELWRCTGFAPLSVYDPATGTGDQIIITLSAAENRGIGAIIDQFTALNPPDQVTSYSTTAIQTSFKLAGTVSLADAVGGISYAVVMPDFTVNFINQPNGFLPTGPAVMPIAGSSLQTAYSQLSSSGAITADWSWGPAHSFAVILASYAPAPVLADAAGCADSIVASVLQPVYYGPQAPQTSLYSGAGSFPHNESSPQVPVTPLATYSWGCYLWQSSLADPGVHAAINWFDNTHTYLSSSFGNIVQTLTPQISQIINATAPASAAFADVSSIDTTVASIPPSPSHSYFAAAMLPPTPAAAANWIAVPSNVVWAPVSGAVVATLAPWWPNYGPSNDIAACLDGFSVVQELIV